MVIFNGRNMVPNMSKDVLSMIATSNVVNKFVCCCENSCVGRTTQRMESRIRQHVAKYASDLFDNRMLPVQKMQ